LDLEIEKLPETLALKAEMGVRRNSEGQAWKATATFRAKGL